MISQAPPGWVVTPLLSWLLAAIARMASLIVVLAGRVPLAIIQTVGERLLKIPVLEATAASGTVTVTAIDNAGYVLDEGALLDIDGEQFVTTAPAIISPGSLAASAPVTAVETGSAGSGLTGPATLVSPTVIWVESIALDSETTGGREGETIDEYVERFADETPTLSTKAILIRDFEALARRDLEVERAMAIDNFVPPSTTGVEGAVTVALVSVDGTAVSSAARTRVETALEADRVLNLDVHVIDPTYTNVDVAFTAIIHAGYDAAATIDEAEQAVRDFLNPARWGLPAEGDQDAWINETTIYRNDLLWAVRDVPGVRRVTALTLGVSGGALSTSDLAITGAAPLPNPVAITGTAA